MGGTERGRLFQGFQGCWGGAGWRGGWTLWAPITSTNEQYLCWVEVGRRPPLCLTAALLGRVGGCWSRGDPWSWGALVWEEESVGFNLLCTSSPCLLLMSFAGVRKLLSLRKEKIAK